MLRGPRSSHLFREVLVVAAVLAAILGVSLLVVRLATPRPVSEQGRPGALIELAEKRLKEVMLRSLEPQLVHDPEVTEPVAAIARRVRSGLPARSGGESPVLTVVVMDTYTVNAFALPGDVIVLCSGLLRSLGSADEAAAVVAHEAGHVVNHDVARTLARQLGISAVLTMLGGREAEAAAQRLLGELINQHYSREVENAADMTGVAILEKAGIDPAALADAFGRLERSADKSKAQGSGKVFSYLQSHPDLQSRIAQAREASRDAQRRGAGPFKPIDPATWRRLKAAL
jgi:beta-barrel assembly-enhancing protease